MRVKITKIDSSAMPDVQTAKWSEYKQGGVNDKSPPIEYWVTGELINPISLGNSIKVARDCRNGEQVSGYFYTSPVVSWNGRFATTRNSFYLVEFI